MSKSIKVKDIVIGEGLPKICVPMVGETLSEILQEAENLRDLDVDIVEWRVDFFEHVTDLEKVKEALKEIRPILSNKPIIFTFRSKREGGQKEVSLEFYVKLNRTAAETNLIDVIDVELFNEEKHVKTLIEAAHLNEVAVIISNHDFDKTPAKEEIIARLRKGAELGGDIPKIAVMPNSTEDVLTLLDATRIAKEQHIDGPIITISMAGKGVISRVSGELFGSALTFGAAEKVSAPGQISVENLRNIIQVLHKNL